MHIRCPQCRNPIELVNDSSLAEVSCPSCGSSFSLINSDSTESFRGDARKIAHFELVRELGIGKFGSVWLAKDTQLDRSVAIKIPRKDALNADEATLFLRDARAAAQLKHPRIVGVHEVGREGDVIYIVSEYIEGANLKEWLASRNLSVREAAELIVMLCDALHHAHESGVVHRDLKPGNIMMDPDGQPHVIDFGLAKRDAGEITMTMDGHILGTPAYMSPEQARGEGHEADRRSDVYSLGVVLYELLTGELPFRGTTQMLLWQIQREEPPRPRKLNASIPLDLETITLKCLEKDPRRRYQSARALADDLERFQNNLPIVGRPLGRAARTWRWCRRALLRLSSVATAAYLTKEADGRAREAESEAKRQRRLAVKGLEEARTAMEGLYSTLLQVDADISTLELEARRKSLTEAEKRIIELNQQIADCGDERAKDSAMASMLEGLSRKVAGFGYFSEALTPATFAVEARERVVLDDCNNVDAKRVLAQSVFDVAVLHEKAGDTEKAAISHARALQLREEIASKHPQRGDCQSDLADSCIEVGRLLALQPGRTADVRQLCERALNIREELVLDSPKDMERQNQLAGALISRASVWELDHRYDESEELRTRAIRIREQLVQQHPKVLDFQVSLAADNQMFADMYIAKGQDKDALGRLEKALGIWERLSLNEPAVYVHQVFAANMCDRIATLYKKNGELSSALRHFDKGANTWSILADTYPSRYEYGRAVARSFLNMGVVFHATQQRDKAAELFVTALDIYYKLAPEHQEDRELQLEWAEGMRIFGAFLFEAGQYDAALGMFDSVLMVRGKLVQNYPGVSDFRTELALAHSAKAIVQIGVHQTAEAIESLRTAVEIYESEAERAQLAPDYQKDLLRSCTALGHFIAIAGNWAESCTFLRRAVELSNRDTRALIEYAWYLSAVGDETEYQSVCRELLAQHSASSDDAAKMSVAEVCVVQDNASDVSRDALSLLVKVSESGSTDPERVAKLGLAQFRAGQLALAIETLQLAMRGFADSISFGRLIAEAVLARAYAVSGESRAAQRHASAARSAISKWSSSPPSHVPPWVTALGSELTTRELSKIEGI